MCASSISSLSESVNLGPPRFNSLPEWLDWQEGLHFTAIELGLDRCQKVAQRMGLMSPDFAVVSIAGTNGKGSSAAMLDAVLRNAGYQTGSYTSPHLLDYNERIRINGDKVTDEMLCHAFNLIDQARGEISLTYFEFGTLAALVLFQQACIDLAIMEVGLGGRLDAVNILDADVALICSIDLDHENWLGHDRDAIGYEKAGILRAARPAVCTDPSPPQSVIDYAADINANLSLAGRDYRCEIGEDTWTWEGGHSKLTSLPKPGFYNDKQIQNAAGVIKVLDFLSDRFPVGEENIKKGLRDFRLSGRFQIVPGEIPLILDVAHNPQSAATLTQNLAKFPCAGKTHLVIGMLKDKNHQSVFHELTRVADFWYVVSLESDRGADGRALAGELSKLVSGDSVKVFDNTNHALELVYSRAQAGDRIVVTGSFLTVGAAIRWLRIES